MCILASSVSHDSNGASSQCAGIKHGVILRSALGQLQPAARLLGASEAAFEYMGAFHQPSDKPEIDRIIEVVRAQLDNTDFQTA